MTNSTTHHHDDLRTAIIEEAITIAEDEGFSTLSIRAIARRLGVSHAAPARHFASRAELLAGVAAAAYSLFADELEKGGQGKLSGCARLSALGSAYVSFALRRPALFRLMFNPEVTELAATSLKDLRIAADRAYGILSSAVRCTLGSEASEEAIRNATLRAWSGAHGAAMLWLDGPLRAMGKRNFMCWAEVSMAQLSHSIADCMTASS
ncbi:WHG domain-containing protein [Cupriavidus sp. CuC1]|uniref:TetR/AcrR family transcriptional regulator n=1 Tax=Cupriavidus sp. CuC1 TaxID=3373131 RepID=UPI0037D3E1D1